MRILNDLSQRPRPAHIPGRRVYVSRDDTVDLAQGRMPENRIEFLGPAEAQDRNASWRHRAAQERAFSSSNASAPPVRAHRRRPRPPYTPHHEGAGHPLHHILDWATGVVLAQVRGTPEHIHNEALLLAAAHGGLLKDLIIRIAGE